MNLPKLATITAISLLLTGCTSTNTPTLTDAESCDLISGAIDSMMVTFDDPNATPESAALVFTQAAEDLTEAAAQSAGEKSQWAASLSALANYLNQNISDSDGDAMLVTLDALFDGFSEELAYCGE